MNTMLKTINVSEKGQIAIPREIQESLGIKKDDRLVVTTKDKKILIQKAANVERHVEDNFQDLPRYSEPSLEKLWNNKKDDVAWRKKVSL